jgi:hypothetical protein
MDANDELSVSVIDFRRHSMILRWHIATGTWSAHEMPAGPVHGVACIGATHPNICLYGVDGGLQLQIGERQFPVAEHSPRIECKAVLPAFGLRRCFTVESTPGGMLFRHAYWVRGRHDFFRWLARRAADPEWRLHSGRRWSDGLAAAVLRAG